jgi:heme-degrading monooxygenase HmoA
VSTLLQENKHWPSGTNSFVSFAAWQDLDSMRAWQGSSEFGKRSEVVHALYEDTQSGGYELVVGI